MEHSYTRDWKPTDNMEVMATRTILMERPPLCPQCHQLPPNHDEKVDTPEPFNIPIPAYDEEAGRSALRITEEAIKNCPNHNTDSDDWTQNVSKVNWTDQQLNLFERVERILDMDQLARLAIAGLPNECLRRNANIEKSVSRMRLALASVHWEPRLTQWLHGLLMAHLPLKYMVSYIDILQALKRKIPTLIDKMLYGKPIDLHLDYLNAISNDSWEPSMAPKTRTLPNQSVIIVVPSSANTVAASLREKRWFELLGTLTTVVPILVDLKMNDDSKSIDLLTEQLIAIVRAKIQEIRVQTPNKHIILVGFNAGAAIAMQVALIEPINSIVCLGFAYNTLNGVRGEPDDRILELTTPVLFVLGQNAQKSSQEEIESLREKMSAQTLLVVVGSSDDSLRVKRLNRTMEGVSQTMIDNMIVDEIQEFATSCILNPPGPRKPSHLNAYNRAIEQMQTKTKVNIMRHTIKRSGSIALKSKTIKNGVRGYKTHHIYNMDDIELQKAFENILPSDTVDMEPPIKLNDTKKETAILNGNVLASPGIRRKVIIPSNQFVHIKPPPRNTHKIYVKPQNAGDQSYTLGVNSIGTTFPISVKNQKTAQTSPTKTITLFKTSSQKCADINAVDKVNEHIADNQSDIGNIDLLDIPILFADNDGNILDESAVANETEKTIEIVSEESSESIDILSAEVVDDSIPDTHDADGDNGANGIDVETTEEPSVETQSEEVPKPKPSGCSNGGGGGFVVLNRNTLKHFKNVRHITHPNNKFKKIYGPINKTVADHPINRNGINNNTTLLNGTRLSISRVVRPMKQIRTIPTIQKPIKFSSISLPATQSNKQTVQLFTKTQSDQSQAKSGILIRKNHLAKVTPNTINRNSFTVRRLNVVNHTKNGRNGQVNGKEKDITSTEQNGIRNDSIEKMDCSSENERKKNDSINDLIAELES